MFDIAEILNYIEFNRTTKIIQSITAPKNALEEKEYKKVSKHYHQKNLLIG